MKSPGWLISLSLYYVYGNSSIGACNGCSAEQFLYQNEVWCVSQAQEVFQNLCWPIRFGDRSHNLFLIGSNEAIDGWNSISFFLLLLLLRPISPRSCFERRLQHKVTGSTRRAINQEKLDNGCQYLHLIDTLHYHHRSKNFIHRSNEAS